MPVFPNAAPAPAGTPLPSGLPPDAVPVGGTPSVTSTITYQGMPTAEGIAAYNQPPVDLGMRNAYGPIRLAPPPANVNPETGLTPGEELLFKPFQYLGEGVMRLGKGLYGAVHPQSVTQEAGALSDVIRGGLQTATPFMLPSMIAHPLAAMTGTALFGGTQALIENSAKAFGMPDEWSRLMGDVAGIFGGGMTYRWLSGMAEAMPGTRQANEVYARLQPLIEQLKDPSLDPNTRAALRVQAQSLMESLRQSEGWHLVPALFPNPNQAQAEAYQYMRENVGVAPSAGAATGSPLVRGAQFLTAVSPVGAVSDIRAARSDIEALRTKATGLVAAARPEVAPDELYGEFRKHEAQSDPVEVPVGIAKDGSIVNDNQRMPVDLRDLKYQLQPIYDQMQWMPAPDRNMSKGYTAVKRILGMGDYAPASAVETGLSGLKAMARGEAGEDGRAQGLAKMIVPVLQEAVDTAVQNYGGDEAVQALQRGRVAAAKQAGADWLTERFKVAQQEGGFGHGARLWQDWARLPDEAKDIMFRDPGQLQELNNFFLGLKTLSENPNPSGSAIVGSNAAHGTSIFTGALLHPAFWLGELTTAGMAKLLRSDTGIKLLTDGLTIPRTTSRGRFIEAQLKNILGSDAPGEAPPPPGTPPSGAPPPGAPPPGAPPGPNQPPVTPAGGATTSPELSSTSAAPLSDRLQDMADAAMDRMRDRGTFSGTKLHAGVPIDDMTDMAIWGAAKLARGVVDLNKWSKEMLKDAGPAAETIKPQLPKLFAMAQKKFENYIQSAAGSLPNTQQLMSLYKQGIAGQDWYAKTHDELVNMFGEDGARVMVRLLAATSPNSTVAANVAFALKAYANWRLGKPLEVGEGQFQELHAHLAEKALRGEDFGGLKVHSFEANMFGDPDAVTVDRWIARAFGFGDKVTDAQYKFADYMLTQIAKRNGVEPRQLQAAIWTAIKEATQKSAGNTSLPFEELLPRKIAADPQMQQLIARAQTEAAPARPWEVPKLRTPAERRAAKAAREMD